jgi:HKD family nuclease
MARRKSTSRFDLHEALNDKSYDHAVICTFTFDAPFFEDYCLDRFNSLSHNGNITVILDRGVYETTILGTDTHTPKTANIRYLLHPVSVPGVFHPKLFLLVSKNKGRLIIGSANFTRPGITSNAELVGCYDYEAEKNETLKPFFQSAFKYLVEIGSRWHGEMLTSNLLDIRRDAPWLDTDSSLSDVADESDFTLLHNLDAPLWEQIKTRISSPVETLYILSRYFDATPRILDKLQEELHPAKIKIFTQNGITSLTPDWLKHPTVKSGQTEIFLCRYKDLDDHAQPLHAKAIIIEHGSERLFAFGSANFTSAALLRTAQTGNAEMLILLSGVHTQDIKSERVFDPNKTAELLKHEAKLQFSRSNKIEFTQASSEIDLFEVILNDDKLNIKADVPTLFEETELRATLTSQLEFQRSLSIAHQQEQMYTADVSDDIKHQLAKASTVIQIEAYEGVHKVGASNSILITHLLDYQNDRPVRRERHIKEAQQSASQFFSALSNLLQGNDSQALLTFLNFCDIPVTDAARPPMFRLTKPAWDGGEGMRRLGERNLKLYLHLHEATLAFFDRHLRRLQRHVATRAPQGIANFLHIYLAMGAVLRAQMERLTQALESKADTLTTREWFDCRNNVNIYFGRFKQMMDLLWTDYLSPMLNEVERDKIKEQFDPDLQPLRDLYIDMLNYRERIERLRTSKLLHRNPHGQARIPNYFDCVFSDERWKKYVRDLKTNLDYVEKSIA